MPFEVIFDKKSKSNFFDLGELPLEITPLEQ